MDAFKAYCDADNLKKASAYNEVNASLAIFSKKLGDVKTKGSSLLFFTTNDDVKDSKNLMCYCIFCHQQVTAVVSPTVDIASLKKHLKQHLDLTFFYKMYPKMSNLLTNIPIDLLVRETESLTLLSQQQINSFFNRGSKRVHVDTEDNESDCMIVEDYEDNSQSYTFKIPKNDLKRLLLTLALNVPFSWYEKVKKNFGVAIADELTKFLHPNPNSILPDTVQGMRKAIDNYISSERYISMCCDGWSVTKPSVSLEAYVITVFKKNQYHSFLHDIVSYDSTTAEVLSTTVTKIRTELGKRLSFITTDGASNNKAAFGNNRSICFCHAINTVVTHMMDCSDKRRESGVKHGINIEEAQCILAHFGGIRDICTKVRGHMSKEFKEWCSDWKDVNVDFPGSPPLPESFCITRWIGIATEMRWVLQYGYLLYRFSLVQGYTEELKGLFYNLDVLQETAWLIFLLEKCMSLLMVDNKPTFHLVIPILEGIREALSSSPCKEFKHRESKSMMKLILFELDEGALSLNSPELAAYKKSCMTATALFPEAHKLVSESVLKECENAASEMFNTILKEHNLDQNTNCNDFDYIIKTLRRKDKYCLKDDDFLNILKPSANALRFRGLSAITKLFFIQRPLCEGGSSNIKEMEAKRKKDKKAAMQKRMKDLRDKKAKLNSSMKAVANNEYFVDETFMSSHMLSTKKSFIKDTNDNLK